MDQGRKIIGVVVLAIVKELVATAYRTEDKSASERIPLISSINCAILKLSCPELLSNRRISLEDV